MDADARCALCITDSTLSIRPQHVEGHRDLTRVSFCAGRGAWQEPGAGMVDAPTGPLRTVIDTGHYDGHVGFMPAYFHTAAELQTEVESAGFTDVVVYGVEGPSWPALDVSGEFDSRRDAALRCARLVERDPLLINASAHLLAIAHR